MKTAVQIVTTDSPLHAYLRLPIVRIIFDRYGPGPSCFLMTRLIVQAEYFACKFKLGDNEIQSIVQEAERINVCRDWSDLRDRVSKFKFLYCADPDDLPSFKQCVSSNPHFHGALYLAKCRVGKSPVFSFEHGFKKLAQYIDWGMISPEQGVGLLRVLAKEKRLALTREEAGLLEEERVTGNAERGLISALFEVPEKQ